MSRAGGPGQVSGPGRRLFFLLWFSAVLLLLAIRLPFLLQAAGRCDSDLSIVGLMAAHISQLKHLPVYFYGQNYLGAAEAYLAGLYFRLFGQSAAALIAAGLSVFTLFAWLSARLVARRTGPLAAWLVLLLMALAPPAMAWWFTASFGGYSLVMLLGVGTAALWLKVLDLGARPTGRLAAAGLAVVAGGLWTYTLFWSFLLPTLLISLAVLARALRKAWRLLPKPRPGFWPLGPARLLLLLGLLDLAHALTIALTGIGYRFNLAGVWITSPSPSTAGGPFLVRALVLTGLGLSLLLYLRLGREGLKKTLEPVSPQAWWLAVAGGGLILARAIHWLGEWSMKGYAPLSLKPKLGLVDWEGLVQRWDWLTGDFVPYLYRLDLPPGWSWTVWLFFLPLPLAWLWLGLEGTLSARRGGQKIWLAENRLALLFCLSSAGLISAVLLTGAAVDVNGYRYLTLLLAWQPFLLVWLAGRLNRLLKPAGTILLLSILLLSVWSWGRSLTRPQAWDYIEDKSIHAPLAGLLEQAGVSFGVAHYWVAYSFDFLNKERLILTTGPEFTGSPVRYLPFDRAVRKSSPLAYIFRAERDKADLAGFQKKLAARGVRFQRLTTEGWICYLVPGPVD